MAKRRRKPEGLENFEALMQPLSKVPKRELDAEIEKDTKRKLAKKKAVKRKKRS